MSNSVETYLGALYNEMKGMNARLDVLIRKEDESIKSTKEINKLLTSIMVS